MLFPLSLLLCALVYWPLNPLIFQGAALILGLSDGLAGLAGQKFGRRQYQITGLKTFEGSAAFFVITCLILYFLQLYAQIPHTPARSIGVVAAALLLTLAEAAAGKGWDNLPVALVGGLAVFLLVGPT